MAARKRYRLGVDVGGTHTDLVLLDAASGELLVEKVSSTPANPALAVLDGVHRFVSRGVAPQDIEFFAHGTTITTNALLEMRGARVGLLVTKGFRGIQEVQAQARDTNLFDYFYTKPEPIAPQSLTHEIPGRISWQGETLVPLDENAVRQAARALQQAGVTSIAVCYLFAFMNPALEEDTRRIILEEYPAAHVSISSEVLPRIREWARMSTTLLNAYLEPVLVRYIGHLEKGLDEASVHTQQRFLMQSNGGVMPFSAAIAGGRTVHTLFSGPAAGAQASAWLAEEAKTGLVTLDMGGTSADIAFIEGGAPLETTESVIARRQLDVPALDMTTISAGGGSIAGVDGGGFLTVGPQSAGAAPGPACYGRGGEQPTVTDADLVCGYLNPDYFLGGAHALDVAAAHRAIDTHVAQKIGMDVLSAALGIRRIVDMRMADEVRVFAAKRGVDLTAYTLLPFGGAGAVHAAAVADELNMRRILVPPRPGAFSALGLLCTDVVHDYIRSGLQPLAGIDARAVENVFRELEGKAHSELQGEGLNAQDASFSRELDLRYTGQGYELRTPLDGLCDNGPNKNGLHENGLHENGMDDAALAAARARFDERHAQIHGHAAADRPVEVVSYRVRLRVSVPKYQPRAEPEHVTSDVKAAIKGTRAVRFDASGEMEAVIYDRERLHPGARIAGPAIVEQFDATTVLPPGWRCHVDAMRNLVLEKDGPHKDTQL